MSAPVTIWRAAWIVIGFLAGIFLINDGAHWAFFWLGMISERPPIDPELIGFCFLRTGGAWVIQACRGDA